MLEWFYGLEAMAHARQLTREF